jgi:hypothetical protein
MCAATGLAGAHGLPAAAGTPAARFWEQALPGSPMPEAIAQLVQKGILIDRWNWVIKWFLSYKY